MFNKFLDILFPPKCPFCGDILTRKVPVCSECMTTLPFIDENSCSICGRPAEEFASSPCADCQSRKIYFRHSFVPLIYMGRAKDAVLALKNSHPYYAKAFAYLLADKILTSDHYVNFDFITFVPQSPRSRRERGYNQAELIAKELSKLLNIKCVPTLIRTNDGEKQHTLSASQRRENVKKCYFKTDRVFDGTVLLVDDIYTTGATANYCSRLLSQMGFKEIYTAIALMRTDD